MPDDNPLVPARLRLGRRHGLVPDRGRDARGRPRRERLGRFCATPGKVRNGDTGESRATSTTATATTSRLMRELGLDAFRFSIAWPRVLPAGRGTVNEAGLDFYDRLVDELLEHGIEPFATLFHWDTPQALEDAGGWPARATAEAFVEYVERRRRTGSATASSTGSRTTSPGCTPGSATPGPPRPGPHERGRRGRDRPPPAALARLGGPGDPPRGPRRAGRDHAQPRPRRTRRRTRPRTRRPHAQVDGEGNRWFLDPIFRGAYPADLLERNEIVAPFVHDGDLAAISAPIDFLGVNNYFRFVVSAGSDGPRIERDAEAHATDMGWEVYPDGLHACWSACANDYAPRAIYVTENGAAFGDVRVHDGRVHDPERTAYLAVPHRRRRAGGRATARPVKGYFVWSLLDNFEWAYGYSKRFGIVYIDYPTLERVPKDSFYWYRDYIANRRGAPRPSPIAAG